MVEVMCCDRCETELVEDNIYTIDFCNLKEVEVTGFFLCEVCYGNLLYVTMKRELPERNTNGDIIIDGDVKL